jgi:hypothetical protein
MGLTLKPSLPKGAMLELLTRHHVGLVLVGTGTIDAMAPVELLQQGMREKLLETKNTRFTPAWLWGMSDMRALTAAAAETSVFRPKKVLATGGSKRGVAAALAGIHDDRFTAILPVVAPILYPPGGAYVRDSDLVDEARQNTLFLENLSPGPNPLGLPATARDALQTRETTRAKQSLSVEMAREAGWSQSDMLAMNQAAWQGCLIAHHLAAVRERGLEFFYHVGTNDNVCPGLRQLGKFHPDFPIYILPGGQHGGPSTTGFTLQTPTQPEADENLLAFARHHFFSDRSLPVCPPHRLRLNEQRSILVVKTQFPKTAVPQSATLAWCANRHAPYTIAAEYDQWQSQALDLQADGSGRGTIKLPSQIQAIDVVVTYESHENGIPFHFSSPYLQWER